MPGYTRADVEMGRRRQLAAQAARGVAVMGSDGARSMQIDTVLFHKTRIHNQRVCGVDNIWAEPEFCADMVRRHPELGVKQIPRVLRIRVPGERPTRGVCDGRMTRFGRVTFHKSY